jgi:hypothetical protein
MTIWRAIETRRQSKKKQNRIVEYRQMLLHWKRVGCFTCAGYILGFPTDTPETIVRDIGIIQRELPVDLLEFFCLTPLPGSEDHKRLQMSRVPMAPDMNSYDLEHVTTAHPRMSKAEWEGAYKLAWRMYYTPKHMETIMRRAAACGISIGKMMFLLIWFYGCATIEKIHPLEGGYLRRKVRVDRRPGYDIENALVFFPKYIVELIGKHAKFAWIIWRARRIRAAIKRDPAARSYKDTALNPVADDDLDELEMFSVTMAARAVADKGSWLDRNSNAGRWKVISLIHVYTTRTGEIGNQYARSLPPKPGPASSQYSNRRNHQKPEWQYASAQKGFQGQSRQQDPVIAILEQKGNVAPGMTRTTRGVIPSVHRRDYVAAAIAHDFEGALDAPNACEGSSRILEPLHHHSYSLKFAQFRMNEQPDLSRHFLGIIIKPYQTG